MTGDRGAETDDAGGDIGSKTEAKLDELALPRGIQLDVEY